MKYTFLTLLAFSFAVFSCNNSKDEKKAQTDSTQTTISSTRPETPAPAMDPAAIQKAMEDFAKPGDMHKWLAKFSGTWDGRIVEFSNPAKPDTTKAVEVVGMTLNGLYQTTAFSGKVQGMPFEGRGITGYDNAKKIFVNSWIDNLSSGIISMTGSYDEKTKTLNLAGTQTNPVTGKDMSIRQEMIVVDDDSYTLVMYGTGPDGKEAKFMEGYFKRRK